MDRSDILAYFNALAEASNLIKMFAANTQELKSLVDSGFDSPILVLSEEYEGNTSINPDTPLYMWQGSFMVLAQVENDTFEAVAEAHSTAQNLLAHVHSYILKKNEEQTSNFGAGKYIKIEAQKFVSMNGYLSARLYGLRVFFKIEQAPDLTYKPADWV